MNGLGTSGVCTSEFSFSVAIEEYNTHSVPPTAEAILYYDENYPIASGFISTRKRQGNTVSFVCYDRMAYTDQTINFSESDFTNGTIASLLLLGKVSSQCGFESGIVFGVDMPSINVPREKVEGRTGREILEMISAAWCGVFRVDNNNHLQFLAFEETRFTVSNINADHLDHTAITEKSDKGPIDQVVMTNGNEEFKAGNINSDVFSTLKISSDLASAELASNILERIGGMIYQAWDCQKLTYHVGIDAVYSVYTGIKTKIEFNDGFTRTLNYAEKSFTAYGIFITCGTNEFSESEFEYLGALSRKIANKISDGEELGNKTLITRYQGTIHLGEKKESKARTASETESEPPKRYGYAPATYEGVVKFDGAMVDKTLPEITVNNDLSGFSTIYGDTILEYELEWNGDNVTLKEKEKEAKE